MNTEFTTLLGEIDRQAANIGLASAGGTSGQYNTTISVYVGGGDTQADSQVSVNLSGATNIVDSTGLGIHADTIDTAAHALTAIADIGAAVTTLGNVQGAVGTGENDLQYAIGLANSQITNKSAAESQIRDADIATEAANLTKSQVLEQSLGGAGAKPTQRRKRCSSSCNKRES